jgi:two-component system, response regulator / RNA-binding antiterminator
VQTLSRFQADPVFDAQPVPTLLLDTELTIRAVSAAYARAVGRPADDLVGTAMFEAFPDNPENAEADGVANLGKSFELVAQQRRSHHMLVQRYDIADVEYGGWLTRVWSPVNSPVMAGEQVIGLLHQVHDITPIGDEIGTVLRGYRDLLLQAPTSDDSARQLAEHADAVATWVTNSRALAAEVANLRSALTSRATIDQAKGIVMAERGCTPEEAFDVLRTLSQNANVRLADVALALVYKCQGTASLGLT